MAGASLFVCPGWAGKDATERSGGRKKNERKFDKKWGRWREARKGGRKEGRKEPKLLSRTCLSGHETCGSDVVSCRRKDER